MAENRSKVILPWVLFGATAIAFAAFGIVQASGSSVGAGNVGEEAVAKIDNEAITANDLYNAMLKQAGPQTVDQLITQRLVGKKAAAENITVTDAELNEQIENIKKNFPSEEVFNQQLEMAGYTVDQLKQELVTEVQLNKLLEPQIQITDEQLQTYFDENKASFATPEEIKASHILVKTKEEAEDILAQLKGGADFAELAKEHSTDGSAAAGGDLGFFGRGKMVPPFEEAAFALEIDEISDIVESQFGFHIIKLTDKKAAATPTFEEKKEEIRDTLFQQERSQKVQPFIEELKAAAKIENFLEKKSS